MSPEPYHKELHGILVSKGYVYHRVYDKVFNGWYDCYRKGSWILSFWQDDYISMVDVFGVEAPLDIFIAETNHIFDPNKLGEER